jgi:hypothetical protein
MEYRERAWLAGVEAGRPTPAFINKLGELHRLIRRQYIPCECGRGRMTEIRTGAGSVDVCCKSCATARLSPVERRQLRTTQARRR